MDGLTKFTDKVHKFFELVESHETEIQKLLKEAEKPIHSILNQSTIFRAVTPEDSVKNTPFEKFQGFRENLIEVIFASLQEEFDRLDAIRCKISAANENLHKEQAVIENLYAEVRKKGLLNSTNLNPCCPAFEHIIGWSSDIWCYYHSLYLQLAQALFNLDYENESTVRHLTKAFKEDSVFKMKKTKKPKMPSIKKLMFNVFTTADIHRLSVLHVKTPLSFNALDHPLRQGLYDPVMGPSGASQEICETCKHASRQCPGHFGHIDLPLPLVNPLFHKDVFTLLRLSCSYCYKMVIPAHLKNLLIHQLRLLEEGHVSQAEELESIVSFDKTESASATDDAMNSIVKDKIQEYVSELELEPENVRPSKTTESLRRKFINNFLRQIVLPKSCSHCKKVFKKIVSFNNRLTVMMTKVEIAEKFKDSGGGGGKQETTFITPKESRQMLRRIWVESKDLIEEFFPLLKNSTLKHPTDLFFMDAVLVTPPKARPVNRVKDQIIEHNQTRAYRNLINDCISMSCVIRAVQAEEGFDVLSEENRRLLQDLRGTTPFEKFQECWLQLQGDVDALLDSDMNKMVTSKGVLGVKQLIEKKEGILRMHMMGKRVNFAARSVITPDPSLQIQEIGIPEYFAKKLTYPTTVTYFNVQELRKMVANGPDVYPGATLVEYENGSFVRLFPGKENRTKREGVAKLLLKATEGRKKVHRHLINGDILLLNRQPTLHRPSIMAHKARILKGEKTLRMHYSNCKSYNADFDGDEMNAHFPQSEQARSEAYNLVNVSSHYLVPKDGTPLGGLIQDHIVSAVRLSVRGEMFGKEDYHQLVFQGLPHKLGNIKLLPPCIVKPRQLWSGKQVVSTILMNVIPEGKRLISFSGKAKISVKLWEREPPREWRCGKKFSSESEMSEFEVIIRKGEMVSGVLDKQHIGATPYGLTHCLYELYGGECSSTFLDSIGRLSTAYLQLNGFTLGVEDILVLGEADQARNEIMERLRQSGERAAAKALDLEQVPGDLTERLEREYFRDRVKFKAKLDQEYKKILNSYTNEINKTCLPRGLVSKFPENNLQLMVTSGAKGSAVNTMQISCLLGQIELEGRRPPWMISGKSLPSFKAFETQPVAGGYVDSRFMTGITPQEFFFHCMAGREGLIDTAVKTSRSGYLQRCLIKHLEGVSVGYDGTVRDHDGSVIQFAYGEDGVEVQKATFLKESCMDFLYTNRDSLVDPSVIKSLKESTDEGVGEYKKRVARWSGEEGRRVLPFTVFSNSIRGDISEKHYRKLNKATGRSKAYSKILKKWNSLGEEEKKLYSVEPRPDPLMSVYNRNCQFGVITEKLETLIQDYLDAKFAGSRKEGKKMRNLMEAKYMLSLCQPGEPVGLLAAQSVGEPSTQMTLNTFHFAGRGEMNVTLGIPRLREVLMTASKSIKTPYIEVPLKKKSDKKMAKNSKKLKKLFQRVTLADVLEKIVVDERLQLRPVRMFTYTVRFQFLPHACYKNEFFVKPKDVLAYMEKPFLIALCKAIRQLGKKYGDIISETKEERAISKTTEGEEENADDIDASGAASKKAKALGEDHESSDEEEELDDDDATKAKLRGRHEENQGYEEPSESEEEKSDEEGSEPENNQPAQCAEEEEEEVPLTKEEMKNVETRRELILKTFAMIKSYTFDVAKEEWCEMVIGIPLTLSKIDFSTMLKSICERSVLYEIPNVKRGFINRGPSGELTLKTEGVNFIEVFRLSKMLDIRKLYSNDIHEVVQTYGVEAGVRVIVRELRDVFGVYGITVDPRHLLLIADYMTHQGYFSPFNRVGMGDSPSTLQQMSFESSTVFLKNALVRRKHDFLRSPSACIMAGNMCTSGTGSFLAYGVDSDVDEDQQDEF